MQLLPALITTVQAALRRLDHYQCPVWWQKISTEQKQWCLGLFFIFTVAFIWVVASFVVQEVESAGLHPFLLSYIANSLLVVYLPIHWLVRQGTVNFSRQKVRSTPLPTTSETEDGQTDRDVLRSASSLSAELEDDSARSQPQSAAASQPGFWAPFQERGVFKAAAVVAPLWFLAQYTFNTSLHLTSITSNTILSSTSSLFTYALACTLLLEKLALRKVLFILLCMTGVGVVAFVDERSSSTESEAHNTLLGDLLCILSAVFYASYTIAIRVMLKDDESASMMLFFGFVGALNLVCLAPVLGILWAASVVDPRQLSAKMFGLTVGKGLFDNALSDYLWARAVLLIGPTVATLGLSLQVPLATGAELAVHSPAWLHNGSWPFMLLGAVAVLAGFAGINVESWTCPCFGRWS